MTYVCTGESSTEILPLSAKKWHFGPDLPWPMKGADVVQYKNTILLIGGENETMERNKKVKTILMYDVDDNKWIQMSQMLSSDKGRVAAFLVPDDFCQVDHQLSRNCSYMQ